MLKSSSDTVLNEREKAILQSIIHLYLLKAMPIGSRNLSKYLEGMLRLSPATIRNVMVDLEEREFISHPHTSSGRVPTDKGYRYFVDSLKQYESLSEIEQNTIIGTLQQKPSENVLKETSKILGFLSKFLGVVEFPIFTDLTVEKVELIGIDSSRLLVVIALNSKIVRTVNLEADFEIDFKILDEISSYINEKVSGRKLRFIRENFKDLIAESKINDKALVRLFIDSVDKIFTNFDSGERLLIAGTKDMLMNPEFEDLGKIRSVIEIIENKDVIIHFMDKLDSSSPIPHVYIGSEMQNRLLDDYALILTSYSFGAVHGSIGVIGPKRMNYPKIISLVNYVSDVLSYK